MAGLVEKFQRWKQKVKHREDRHKADKVTAFKESVSSIGKVSTGYSSKYADGWDRIFGGEKSPGPGGPGDKNG